MNAKSCLVVAAHPDDEALGCGGTIALLASQGTAVHIVFMTDGVSARSTKELTTADVAAASARRRNAERAAAMLGAASVRFGQFPDNRMDRVDLLDVTKFIEGFVAEHRPDLVLTHHAGDLNVDHRVVQQAVMTACRPQPGQSVTTILFFEVVSSTEWQAGPGSRFSPNWFVDIASHLEAKRRALREYATEMRPWPHSRSFEAVEHLARWRGASVGVEAAEAFEVGRVLLRG